MDQQTEDRLRKLEANKANEDRLKSLEDDVRFLMGKRVTQVDVVPQAIKQRHLEANIVFQGLEADLPDGSTEVKVYWCTDSFKLKIWTGAAWKSATLT